MIERRVSEFGFDKLTIVTKEGGRIVLSYYGGRSDIGSITSSNPSGLGYSEYIRDEEDINNKIDRVNRHIWLTDEEKIVCIDFLNAMKQG